MRANQRSRCRAALAVTLPPACAIAVVVGCAAPPRSHVDHTRVGVTQTTGGDYYSPQANMPDLYRFGDEVGMRIAREIALIPEVRDSPTRVVIELGTLNNETGTSTNDFELIQRRLFSKIQRSSHLRDYAMVVEHRRYMERDYREIVGSDDEDRLLEGKTGDGGPRTYDPDITYVLQGHFYEAKRGNTHRYLFEFQLANLGSRAIVFNRTFDSSHVTP